MKRFGLLLAILVGSLPSYGWAAPPFTAVVLKVKDGDTIRVIRSNDGAELDIRVHWMDSPEIAHNSKEIDQPGGREAKAFGEGMLEGHRVTLTPRGHSYGRIVADVRLPDGIDYALSATMRGYNWLDPRYKPSSDLQAMLKFARENRSGIWRMTDNIPPWDWRKKSREAKHHATH